MAADLTITVCAPVQAGQIFSGPAGEVIPVGAAVYIDTSTGKFMLADGSSAGPARVIGLAVTAATVAGQSIDVIRSGVVAVGNALSALTYDDDVFLSDTDHGILADTAGTVSVTVGRVLPNWTDPSTPDKLLLLTLD